MDQELVCRRLGEHWATKQISRELAWRGPDGWDVIGEVQLRMDKLNAVDVAQVFLFPAGYCSAEAGS